MAAARVPSLAPDLFLLLSLRQVLFINFPDSVISQWYRDFESNKDEVARLCRLAGKGWLLLSGSIVLK